MELDDIRQDIFELETSPKVITTFRGDTAQVYLNLKKPSSAIHGVVFNCDGLPDATALTLVETTLTTSKWLLTLNASQTSILAPKTFNFTMTLINTNLTELTLYRGLVISNNRVFSNNSNNYYLSPIIMPRKPEITDDSYMVGTLWIDSSINRMTYILLAYDEDIPVWLEFSAAGFVYDNEGSTLLATTIKTALDELDSKLNTVVQRLDDTENDVVDLQTDKADKSDTYTKAEVYNKTEVYSKVETESKISDIEDDITKIENGTTVVGESVYASKDKSERNLIDLVHKTRTILGLDLADDILLGEFKTALGNATESVAGLMSETDKARLNALHALLNEESANDVVDAINEILAIFENYPEGVDLVTALAGKVDKEVGKGLSANDYSDTEKNKVALSDTHRQTTGNPHNTTFAQVGSKPTTLSGYGITDAYTKEYIDAMKDQNGWESELITETPLVNSDTVSLATLQAFDMIKLFARNTATNEIDTDSFDTSVGLVVGYEYRLFDNANIKLTIGTPNCTFTDTVGGYELKIIGVKYTELVASDVAYDNEGSTLKSTTVQGAIDEHDREIEELKYAPIINKSYGDKINATTDFVPNANGKPLLKQVDGMQIYAPQLVTNGDFSDGTTGWALRANTTQSVTNGINTIICTSTGNDIGINISNVLLTLYTFYLYAMVKPESSANLSLADGGPGAKFSIVPNVWQFVSGLRKPTDAIMRIFQDMTVGQTLLVDYVGAINTDFLKANKQYSPIYNTTFDLMSDAQIKIQMDAWVQDGILPNDNLQAVTNTKVKTIGKNLFDKSKVHIDKFVNQSGELTTLANYLATDYIRIKPSTTYCWSNDVGGLRGNCWYDINKVFIGYTLGKVLAMPSNAHYVRLNLTPSQLDTSQLEQGSTATAYAPYKSGTLELTHTPLYRLPNGVKDIVRYDNGQYVKDKYVQEYTIQASDITSMFVDNSNLDYAITVNPSGAYNSSSSIGVQNQAFIPNWIGLGFANSTNNIGTWYKSSSSQLFLFGFAKGTTLAQAQTALAGTKIYYQLATPLLANELVNADGQLIQENPTTLIQEQTLNTEYDIDFTIDTKKQVVANMNNVALKADKTYVDSQDLTKADKVVLTNLVTNGDFSNGTTGWTSNTSSSSVTSNILINTGDGVSSTPSLRQDVLLTIGDVIYVNAKMRSINNNILSMSVRTGNDVLFVNQDTPILNQWYTLSGKNTSSSTSIRVYHTHSSAVNALNSAIEIDYVFVINLTAIFGAGNEPTKEQMDAIMTLKGGYFSTATLNVIDVMKLFTPKAQEAWLTPTLLNGWVNVGGEWATAGYMKDTLGFVHIKGMIKSGTVGQIVFSLPVGYRPAQTQSFSCTSNNAFGFVDINTNGAVAVKVGNNNWFALTNLSFKAEA